ncbi:hypothetical protein M0R19_01405 [Candidatus Pacearchaeota archaeon]|nr:hypothetical protein [Candidatus Pacearchaeota archaeon]
MRKRKIILMLIIAVALGFIIFSYIPSMKENTSFEVTPILFKIILDKGETINASFNIYNFGNEENFNFNITDLNKILFLEKDNFIIPSKESKTFNISLSGKNASYGVYVGHISISKNIEEKKIPVIASIQTEQQLFAITLNVPPENKQLGKKANITTEVKFFNLYDNEPHTINVNYEMFDIYGNKIFLESEDIAIGAKSSFTKKFPLPENIDFGDYVFAVNMNYLDTVTTASYLFSVTDKKSFSFLNINFLAIIVAIFVVLTFFLILFVAYERSLLLSRVKRQHKLQIKTSSEEISKEKEKYLAKAKNEKQKRKIIKQFRDAKERFLTELLKQQKNQIEDIKKIKKEKLKEKEKIIAKWNRQGYTKAIETAQISSDLKDKLAALKTAYDEGFIRKESYEEGVSDIQTADKKLKRNLYK